jgi:hypothetical protein
MFWLSGRRIEWNGMEWTLMYKHCSSIKVPTFSNGNENEAPRIKE